jgi:uncharacterized protein (DUF2267 family)
VSLRGDPGSVGHNRSGGVPEEAEAGVRAVFGVLRLAVTTGELRDAMSKLPKEFSELVKQS